MRLISYRRSKSVEEVVIGRSEVCGRDRAPSLSQEMVTVPDVMLR